MTWTPLDTGNRWAVLGLALTVLAGVGAVSRATDAWALVNESPSLPRGLYARAPGGAVVRGAVVAVPQPEGARAYLRDLGMPSEVRLIKRVAAVEGDRVCRTGSMLHTPGRVSPVLERDRRGRALAVWSGCRRLTSGEVFLLGDTHSSFDSRYFGPIDTGALTGVYRAVVTW